MTRLSICLVALLATACSDSTPRATATRNGTAEAGIRDQIAGDMAAVRLKAAEDRITQLERQVGELENKPEKLDLQLLTQRVEQMEARVYAKGDALAPEVAPSPRPAASPGRAEPKAAPSPAANRFNPFGL